ncbi:hypothetical protein IGI04_018828 [Brassica rapa subsp. trilocularis]|uniref:Uncharacterized protein n=1 Tax=Brassica rapa subsp. trilocularis TaxID=1813537 RepID=A0ABQ7ME26_BRACM|nr:hypothetical protein IGI04_018828 [Brassica rapa subsp. trilocularis]
MVFRFTLGFLTDKQGWLSYWSTCGCALLLALADVLEGFVHTLHKVITKLLDIKLKQSPSWIRFTFGYPRGMRTDGSRGDTKGCRIAQRYYQTSIVAGCDAPLDHMSSKVKLDGKDKPQYGQIGHLAMVPAKAPFRTYAGRSSTLHGQSVRSSRYEPARQTLLHSHSKLHGVDEDEVFKDISFPLFASLVSQSKTDGRKDQRQQTHTQLSEHKANNRNNKVNGSTATEAEAALVVAKRPDSGEDIALQRWNLSNPSKEITRIIKQKLVETRQSSYSGAVPAFDARKNIYSPVEFQEDRFDLFAKLPIPSCNILIKCGDLREKLPVEED